MEKLDWFGCYDGSWQSAPLVPEAYSHPAKMSFNLAERIYRHMLAEGWLTPGGSVVDPFGGIGGTAFHAALYGLHWTGVELEPKFVDLAGGHECTGFTKAEWRRYYGRFNRIARRDGRHICVTCLKAAEQIGTSRTIPEQVEHHFQGNIELWAARYGPHFPAYGTARIVQGDSRNLAALIGDADGVVSSPPYSSGTLGAGDGPNGSGTRHGQYSETETAYQGGNTYGQTPGQLGALPAGDFDAAVSSPPYAETINANAAANDAMARAERKTAAGIDMAKASNRGGPNSVLNQAQAYGSTPGQLGALPAGDFDAAVSSPPYETGTLGAGEGPRTTGAPHSKKDTPISNAYADNTPGNIDSGSPDTFWAAARVILEQTYAVLRPGAVAAFVTGDFVRNKQRVPFGAQWLALCESVGFEPLAWATAWKQTNHGAQLDIFGEAIPQTTTRVSFFRRLANQKNPDAAILNEDVLFVRKPGGVGHGYDGSVSSPPFQGANQSTDADFLQLRAEQHRNGSRMQPGLGTYGSTPGQLGAMPAGEAPA